MICSTFVWSQHTVSGSLKDTESKPVAYANVLLLKSLDSTFVNGTSSNEKGVFTLDNVTSGDYILKASFVGYEDKFKAIQVEGNIDLQAIILKESVESLSEVEIVYKKPSVKKEVDRLVFDVENSSLSEGNMMDVLKSTPSVLVIDDALMVKGNAPAVYINDRKVHLSASELVELLEGTSATNIKSVQVITNPSSKYDADSGVVVNIVMSKNLVTGYNGNAFTNFTQGVFPRMNIGTSHYFKGSKVDLFFNYSYNSNKINRDSEEHIFYPTETWKTNLNRNTYSETHNIGFNFDYELNNKSTIALAATTQFLPYYKYKTNGEAEIEGNSFYDEMKSHNLSRDQKHNMGFDLDYILNISEKSKFTWNSHYTDYHYDRDQEVNSIYYDLSSLFGETAFNTRADQTTRIFTSQIDYSTSFNENSSFDAGLKYSDVEAQSEIDHYDVFNGITIYNGDYSDNFEYNENVLAAYVNYNYNNEKWSFQAGLRAEQTNIDNLSSTSERNKQDYFKIFPTANLSYQWSESVNTYFTYKRSLQRPNYSNLNPFKFYLNDITIITGNPDLQPVFSNTFLIGTTLNDKFTFEVHYKTHKNNIFELPLQDNIENNITYTPLNIDETIEIGIDFETYFDITNSWFLYFGTSTFNFNDKGDFFGSNVQLDKWANYSILSNDFTFLKDKSLTANLTLIYISENVQGLQSVDSRFLSDISIKKSILKGKGVLSLAVSDLFNQQDFFVSTKFLDQNSTLFTNLDNRYIKLGFRYKFGNNRLSTNQRSTNKEERNRLNQNNH